MVSTSDVRKVLSHSTNDSFLIDLMENLFVLRTKEAFVMLADGNTVLESHATGLL
jgi:hypothetical protein